MSDMIDMWLSMNSCIKDKNDDIYFVVDGESQLVGRYNGFSLKDGTLYIDITPQHHINFINVKVVISKDSVEFEE